MSAVPCTGTRAHAVPAACGAMPGTRRSPHVLGTDPPVPAEGVLFHLPERKTRGGGGRYETYPNV